ncbi:hypothetical protein HYT02_05160 [Candidatus Gottesmanbacteria bacterium]|nr:hypothetical protein [Candidatus Gottesmanbacteria bacterium]
MKRTIQGDLSKLHQLRYPVRKYASNAIKKFIEFDKLETNKLKETELTLNSIRGYLKSDKKYSKTKARKTHMKDVLEGKM